MDFAYTLLIILGMLILFAFAVILQIYFIYVSLIKKKNKVKEAFSGINVHLKMRYDLIPNILTIANKFMEHERGLMEDLTKLRTKALSIPDNYKNIEKKLDIDNEIKNKMQQLLVSVENYPQLKSDTTMLTAMQTYNEVEEHIAAARRFFNSAVNDLNNAVEIFPSSLIANMIGISKQEFFAANETETKSINANDYFKK